MVRVPHPPRTFPVSVTALNYFFLFVFLVTFLGKTSNLTGKSSGSSSGNVNHWLLASINKSRLKPTQQSKHSLLKFTQTHTPFFNVSVVLYHKLTVKSQQLVYFSSCEDWRRASNPEQVFYSLSQLFCYANRLQIQLFLYEHPWLQSKTDL